MTLSLVMLAHRNENVVLANLQRWGALFDEVVVGVDSRAGEEFTQHFDGAVDKLFVISEIEEFANSAWLSPLASSDWALILDSDELISEALGEYLAAREYEHEIATQIAIPMRWVWPDSSSFLVDEPWRFDPQIRLINLRGAQTNYPTSVHEAVAMEGPVSSIRHPLYHLDLVINLTADRKEKVRTYELRDPDVMPGFKRSISAVYYLPEERKTSLRTSPLHSFEIEAIDKALSNAQSIHRLANRVTQFSELSVSDLKKIGREKFDRSAVNLAKIEVIHPPTRAISGMAIPCDVEVVNTSDRTFWPRRVGRGVAVGWKIFNSLGQMLAEGRGDLTSEVRPGDSQCITCWLLVSGFSGDITVEFRMVDEGIQWFEDSTVIALRVEDEQSLFD